MQAENNKNKQETAALPAKLPQTRPCLHADRCSHLRKIIHMTEQALRSLCILLALRCPRNHAMHSWLTHNFPVDFCDLQLACEAPAAAAVAMAARRCRLTDLALHYKCAAAHPDFAQTAREHAVTVLRRHLEFAKPAQQGPAQRPYIFPAPTRCCWKCWNGTPPFAKPCGACSCPAGGARSASRLGIQTTVVPSGPALATAMRRGNQRSALTGATWPVQAATSVTSALLTGAPALVLTRHTRIARSSQPAPSGGAWARVCGLELFSTSQLTRAAWHESPPAACDACLTQREHSADCTASARRRQAARQCLHARRPEHAWLRIASAYAGRYSVAAIWARLTAGTASPG